MWRRQWHPTPVLLPGKSHGWRSLVGCSPWDRQELGTTEWLHFHFPLSCIGEGNGNLLQCSCLENPRDGGAWWAAIYGVVQSWTWLKWLSSSSRKKNDEEFQERKKLYVKANVVIACYLSFPMTWLWLIGKFQLWNQATDNAKDLIMTSTFKVSIPAKVTVGKQRKAKGKGKILVIVISAQVRSQKVSVDVGTKKMKSVNIYVWSEKSLSRVWLSSLTVQSTEFSGQNTGVGSLSFSREIYTYTYL